MSCNKTKFLQLTLLFVLALISCKKENLTNLETESPTEIPTPEINFQPTKNLILSSIDNSQVVLDMEKAIRELMFKSLVQTAFYPEVYGFNIPIADTRTGCPCSTLNTASGAGGVVHTITLDYGTGCGTTGNADYEGIVTLTINGELNVAGTTASIQLDSDFKINSVNDMDGNMTFTYMEVFGEDFYELNSLNLQNTNTTNSSVTNVELVTPALNGGFYIGENPTGDPGNSLDILNDTIQYGGCFKVNCPNGQNLRSCTIADIFYSIPCGTPFDGNLILDTLNTGAALATFGEYGDADPLNGTFGNMDFAYPSAISVGVCDSLVEFTDNIENTVNILNL